MNTKELRTILERQRGQQAQLNKSLSTTQDRVKENTRDLRRHEEAREIIQKVGLETQQQLQYHISDITTLALDAVFPEPYQLVAEFVERRNKTECDLYFVREGNKTDPEDASGGGAVDVASFALRIASWSMERPRTRPVMLMDEPLKFLSVDLQEKASLMIKELANRLGIQFIIITHEETLTEYADRVFQVNIKKGKSKVTQS